jgi:hypothetical protein
MKYELAYSNRHNCIHPKGHCFKLIQDKQKIKAIRKEHPKMIYALWECYYCKKITQST